MSSPNPAECPDRLFSSNDQPIQTPSLTEGILQLYTKGLNLPLCGHRDMHLNRDFPLLCTTLIGNGTCPLISSQQPKNSIGVWST